MYIFSVFTRKCRNPIYHVVLTVHNTSVGILIHRQQTIYKIFTRTKVNSIYRHKLIGPGLMKHQALLAIRAKLELAIIIIIFLFFFFHFSVAIDSGEILANVWQERENFSRVLKRCYVHVYPNIFLIFCCIMKSCVSSTSVKLTVE